MQTQNDPRTIEGIAEMTIGIANAKCPHNWGSPEAVAWEQRQKEELARVAPMLASQVLRLHGEMQKLETCSVHGCKVTIRKDCWWCAGETLDGIGG